MTGVGPIGVWSAELRVGERAEACDAAAELEQLGYSALWLPGRGEDVFARAAELLAATSRVAVATGIISIWTSEASSVAREQRALAEAYPGRFLLGIGVSHATMVDRTEPGRYRRPLGAMGAYLDELDAAPGARPPSERVIAALAPRMLALAGARSAGSHPYLTTPAHTLRARELLGPGPLLAPEQTVMLEENPELARAGARNFLTQPYLSLENYRRSWLAQGFTESDLAHGGSERLLDAIVPWGSPEAIAARVGEQHRAGADHVCVQVLGPGGSRGQHFPREQWRALAPALLDLAA